MTPAARSKRERFTVAIVGGGASGTLVASMLLRRSPQARVAIVDPCERLGRGVAYATDCPRHLLNVPAGKMSAFPAEPDHFVRWLAAHADPSYGPKSFVARSLYGDYLSEIAVDARAAAPERLRHVKALAVAARAERDGVYVRCSDGSEIVADALVIASGNAAPAAWPNIAPDAECSGRYFDSAWAPNATLPGSPDETVLLLGMGLTAIDAVFGLRYNGHRGTIVMVSRRGLLPHEHRVFDAPPSTVPEAKTVSELLDTVRTVVRDLDDHDGNWRGVIDDVRPHTNALWQALSLEEQRRFLRHALPYWNVHRHRLAPEAAKDFAELLASGAVRVLAGRTGEVTADANVLRVPINVRGSGELVTIDADRVINCSGPQHDFRKLPNPLLQSMLADGSMAANPLGIGVRVAENGALVGADGLASNRVFAIGPARFGTLIETTAIPEIREQARDLAESLARGFGSGVERSRMRTSAIVLAAIAIACSVCERVAAATAADPIARWFASSRCAAFDGGWTGSPPVVKRDSQGVVFDPITANTRGTFYDPKSGRALFYPNRDSEGIFLLRFSGPPPAGVARHDLSKLRTASGITLGSSSERVSRLLGKPAIVRKCGLERYVYLESAEGEPQTLQFTIDRGRVTEIFEDFPG